MRFAKLVAMLVAPLLLASCLLTPGKFVSTLDIRADRSFSFTYVGEAILVDPSPDGIEDAAAEQLVAQEPAARPGGAKPETQAEIVKRRAIAEALGREDGYRSAQYLGEGKYRVDYAISGRLDRNFVYPFNSDAGAVLPWIAIELRKDRTARVRAPAFGEGQSGPGALNPMEEASRYREGSFTFTTDAELVMHNQEGSLAPGPGKKVVWTVTPTSKTVPTAVVRFAD